MSDSESLEDYDPAKYPPIAVTVDIVLLTIRDDSLAALLIRRGGEPFKGCYALPGGFVQPDETLAAAAARELEEETGARGMHLEQLGTYGDPGRDPRMRVVSVAYLALIPNPPEVTGGSDAESAEWSPVATFLDSTLPDAPSLLAFDHRQILRDGVERARGKLEYSGLATAFCGSEFTVGELRRVYEIVWGVDLDARNFHRKVTGTLGFLEPTGEMTTRGGGRPAQLFRRGATQTLNPPILRPSPTVF
ncbi:NUDIX hydrolase [Kineosporia corallincola]|uniref:NUDIX hydrolase n=1 Tax=Kineosporia corallincola TaxID=2835133 RepID=UPI0027DEFAD3|nr:NUDIX domain-containing protein [Kineosporia corallincola]